MNDVSEQQRRENRDPQEGKGPVPLSITLLAGLLGVFGVAYILYSKPESPALYGDGRSSEELQGGSNVAPDTAAVANAIDGEGLFTSRCAVCHQATGAGLPGVFPPLAQSEWVTGNERTLSAIVLHGIAGQLTVRSQTYNGVMPPFKDQLSDAEIAAVITYIRGAWGNGSSAVAADVVAKIRAETADRASFNGDEELAKVAL